MIDKDELAQELLDFINSIGAYYKFIDWEKERGYDEEELEQAINSIGDNGDE